MLNMPDFVRPVTLSPPVTTNGGVTSDYISMANIHKVYIVATFRQAVAHATTISVYQATDTTGTSAKILANAVPLWTIANVASTDLFTRQDDAVTATLAATTASQKVLFCVDASALDGANGFDCLNVVVPTSSQATNFVNIDAVIIPRYGEKSVI